MDLFQHDDYDELAHYFKELRDKNIVDADPSGWLDTYAESAGYFVQPRLEESDLARYCIDEGSSLGKTKLTIVSQLSCWESFSLDPEEVTLFHSVSAATLATLNALQRSGIKTIIFETPAYGVTIKQAKSLGLITILLPTYRRDDFRVDWSLLSGDRHSPYAIWLTQPRMSLGYNQDREVLMHLQARLSAKDFLVIDEATEQEYPSHLRNMNCGRPGNTVRLRGFLKGAGLNGVRLAFVLHDRQMRSAFETAQELAGNSLDVFSLRAICEIARRQNLLPQMLAAARQQTTALRTKAEKIVSGTRVEVGKLVNGYIGCAFIKFGDTFENHAKTRARLLSFCRDRRMPILLGSNMRFAFDAEWECVRLNYFNHPRHITKAMLNLVDFAASL